MNIKQRCRPSYPAASLRHPCVHECPRTQSRGAGTYMREPHLRSHDRPNPRPKDLCRDTRGASSARRTPAFRHRISRLWQLRTAAAYGLNAPRWARLVQVVHEVTKGGGVPSKKNPEAHGCKTRARTVSRNTQAVQCAAGTPRVRAPARHATSTHTCEHDTLVCAPQTTHRTQKSRPSASCAPPCSHSLRHACRVAST